MVEKKTIVINPVFWAANCRIDLANVEQLNIASQSIIFQYFSGRRLIFTTSVSEGADMMTYIIELSNDKYKILKDFLNELKENEQVLI